MATKKKPIKAKAKKEYVNLNEVDFGERVIDKGLPPVKLEVFKSENTEPKKTNNPFARAFTAVNLFLFLVAAILLALAIMERGRDLLDFVAAVVFLAVMVKIMLDGYNIKYKGE